MAFIIMIPILIIISLDGWQIEDNAILLIAVALCWLNWKDATNTDTEDYYGGY